MEKLAKIIWNVSIDDAKKEELKDSQFISLKKLFENIKNKDIYLFLVLANALVCYQLSGKWEAYWEEFSNYFSDKTDLFESNLIDELAVFISNSKNNKRLLEVKKQRLEKLKKFISMFQEKQSFYYENMEILRNDLALLMNQARDAKTIVFAIKMFSYAARNYFDKFIEFPYKIEIPIDSRLENIYDIYNENKELKIKDFYSNLSKKLSIPPLHLDAIIWCNYEKLKK